MNFLRFSGMNRWRRAVIGAVTEQDDENDTEEGESHEGDWCYHKPPPFLVHWRWPRFSVPDPRLCSWRRRRRGRWFGNEISSGERGRPRWSHVDTWFTIQNEALRLLGASGRFWFWIFQSHILGCDDMLPANQRAKRGYLDDVETCYSNNDVVPTSQSPFLYPRMSVPPLSSIASELAKFNMTQWTKHQPHMTLSGFCQLTRPTRLIKIFLFL